jgi:alkylation response protein AidB-like acyl-CoA dehydrogenase
MAEELNFRITSARIATGAYESALKYSHERKAFCEIFNHQAIVKTV